MLIRELYYCDVMIPLWAICLQLELADANDVMRYQEEPKCSKLANHLGIGKCS